MFCRQAWSFRNSGKHRLLQRNIVRFLLFLIIEEKLGRVVLFEHLEGGLWLLGLTRQLGKVTSLWMIRSGSAEYALNRLPPPHSSSFRLFIFNPFVCSFIPRRRTTIGWFRHAFARVKSTRIGTGSIAAMPCVTDNFRCREPAIYSSPMPQEMAALRSPGPTQPPFSCSGRIQVSTLLHTQGPGQSPTFKSSSLYELQKTFRLSSSS